MDQKMRQDAIPWKETERGAIIIEATLSLSFFMFAMFTLLSVVQIAYAQSRMSVALTSATKSITDYAHVYFATEMDKAFSGTGGESSKLFGQVGEFLENVGGELGPISEELSQFVIGAGQSMSATSVTDILKNLAGEGLVLGLMNSNLGDGSPGSAEAFKKKYHIKNISLLESKVLEDGNQIFFRVEYDIEVIKLLNVDYTFKMSTWAYADAWSGVGVSAASSGGS